MRQNFIYNLKMEKTINKQVILAPPWKFKNWQITKIIDMFGHKKIQIRSYYIDKYGRPNYKKRCQQIYADPGDWERLKREIRKNK